jgi:hypothetical protein
MKKFLLSLFTFISFISQAQKYQPMDSTMVWNAYNLERVSSGFCCYVNHNSSYQFHGFVINNGNTWLKLYSSGIRTWVFCQNSCGFGTYDSYTNQFFGYVMNDSLNKKVYFRTTLTPNFTPGASELYYDFYNKNVGDSLLWSHPPSTPPNSGWFKILSIDSFLFAGNYHKRFEVINNVAFNQPRKVYVMEGIGSTLGPWNSVFTDFEAGSSLSCFSKPQQGVSVSSYTTFAYTPASGCGTINAIPNVELPVFSIHPNPASIQLSIEKKQYDNVCILDIFGKIVLEQNYYSPNISVQQLPTGLYFLKLRSGTTIYNSKFIKD